MVPLTLKLAFLLNISICSFICSANEINEAWSYILTNFAKNNSHLTLDQFKTFVTSLQCHKQQHDHHNHYHNHHHDHHQHDDDHQHDEDQHNEDHNHGHTDHHYHDHDKDKVFCSLYHSLDMTYTFDKSSFINQSQLSIMCLPILHHLSFDQSACSLPNDNISDVSFKHYDSATWGYAFLACLVISLVGLVAVAIIPLMHRVVYNHVLQFLVAMAIGSMSGDALLHLIPHAFSPSHNHDGAHSHHDHQVWLGLTALVGIFVFFVVERFVGICSERKRMKNKDKKHQSQEEIAQGAIAMLPDQSGDKKEIGTPLPARLKVAKTQNANSCEEMLMVVHTSKDIKKMASDAQEDFHKNCDEAELPNHQAHTHHHHSHQAPGSVAAVAWMVIVGDGFHNFADGLAIGSAFSSSIQDGLSTSIAVFCHELPHELGDFAMLLSAGMSGKQALVYNCVSSILCLLGMCVGVLMGGWVKGTPWIFMLIGGMFLYIALVDMLPEMKSVVPKTGEHPFLHLALQVAGWLVGSTIMLLIALYEEYISIPA